MRRSEETARSLGRSEGAGFVGDPLVKSVLFRWIAVVVLAALAACRQGATEQKKSTASSMIANGRVVLDARTAERIGLEVARAELHSTPRTRTVGGDVLPSSGRSILVVAPIAGRVVGDLRAGQMVHRGDAVLRLTPVASVDRDLRAQADRSESVAESRLTAAEARLSRAEKLLADGAASARQVEEARADRDVAKAELDASKSRLGMLARAPLEADVAALLRAPEDGVVQKVSAGSQSLVPAGAPLFELVGTGALWVKVSVFVGDLRSIQAEASARIRPLTASPVAAEIEALPVNGPPTADPATATADIYFALPKEGIDFRPGERVSVTLTYRGEEKGIIVPLPSIVRDANGAAWIYEVVGEHTFERRRVDVEHVFEWRSGTSTSRAARLASHSTWVKEGTRIVAAGSVELLGLELGAGK